MATETRAHRNRQLRSLVLILLMLLSAYVFDHCGYGELDWSTKNYVYLAAALLILGSLIGSLSQWRCPGCKKNLWRWFNPSHCPGCGLKLRR